MDLLKTLWGKFVRRPGIPSHLLAAVWLILVVAAASNADVEFTPFFLAVLGGLVLGGLWCAHTVVYFFHTATLRLKTPLTKWEITAWFVLPLIVVLAAGIWKTRLPLRVRFRLSEQALLAAHRGDLESGRAGLFSYECRTFDTDLKHLRTCSALFDEAGFVYSINGRPDVGEEWRWALTYRHFRGPWYIWRWSD